MERAGRYSHVSALSAAVAGALALAGAIVSKVLQVNYNVPARAAPLAAVWGAVLCLSILQAAAFHIAKCRRRGEPAWSHLTCQVVVAMLPALFVGAAITVYGFQTGQLDLLPPIWLLAYGSSLMGLGLYAGGRIQIVGALFMLLGAAGLWWWKEYGLRLMFAGFGGLHILLGVLLAWKPRA